MGASDTNRSSTEFTYVDNPAGFRDPAALVVRIPAGLRSKEKLFAVLADNLRFPAYFGWNWDALEECLGDLSWLPEGKAVALVHEGLPFGVGGENRGIYLAVLKSAQDHWAASRSRSLQVVFPESTRQQITPAASEPR